MPAVEPFVAVVTGAASGIGWEISRRLLDDGMSVIGIDIDDTGLVEATHRLDAPAHFVGVVGDVADPATHTRAAVCAAELGRLTTWVNNAAVDVRGSVLNTPPGLIERCLAVNIGGVFWGTCAAVQAMLHHGGGSIVNISSGQAFYGLDSYAIYAASKGAVVSLTRQVAAEFAQRAIRCNAIAPGVIVTPELERELTAHPEQVAATHATWDSLTPIGRWGRPADVAALAVFLASPNSEFITGEAILVDGGLSAVAGNYSERHPRVHISDPTHTATDGRET